MTSDRLRHRLAVGVLAAACTGAHCRPQEHTLAPALTELAPDYRPKVPATADPELGRHFVGRQPATNACFDGAAASQSVASWQKVELVYGDVLGSALRADFSTLIQFPASASVSHGSDRRAKVTLTDLAIERIDDIFFNPSSACADELDDDAPTMARVLTRAYRASTIDIEAEASVRRALSVDVAKIGGAEVNAERSSTRRLAGVKLYFGEYLECVRVQRQTTRCPDKGWGSASACTLGTCSFMVTAAEGDSGWHGTLSCEGGGRHQLAGTFGEWAQGQRTASGVSYNVNVSPGQSVGAITIDLRSWTVRSAPSDACEAT